MTIMTVSWTVAVKRHVKLRKFSNDTERRAVSLQLVSGKSTGREYSMIGRYEGRSEMTAELSQL